MALDVLNLRQFYATSQGVMVRALLTQSLEKYFIYSKGMTILGFGYPTPYMGLVREKAARSLAFMPAHQGVVHWPTGRPSKAALYDETALPLPDAVADKILLIHALENASDATAFLSEIWRSLSAGGKLILVVPNRASLWARNDATPFGYGTPFSRGQILNLLENARFTPLNFEEALWLPPSKKLLRFAPLAEKWGGKVFLPLGGVHIIEAQKQVYRPIGKLQRKIIQVRSLNPAFNSALKSPL
jgi:SAM-dependent methyltransferase